MALQFPEHDEGKKSTNPKVQKLDKLARLLKVEISIDGVKYGNIDENGSNKMVTPKDVVEKYASETSSESQETGTENSVDTDTNTDTSTTRTETNKDFVSSDTQPQQKTKKRGRPKKTT